MKRASFKKLIQEGKRYSSKLFTVWVCGQDVLDEPANRNTAAFAVSKRLSKKAVVRNKIRRRAKEIFRLCLIEESEGKAFLFKANEKVDVERFTFFEMEKEIKQLLSKAGCIREQR